MSKPLLALIVATTLKGEIGYQNTIPWNLDGDLKRFQEITKGHIVIMGTNTYDSLKRPDGLPNRYNIVIGTTHIARNIGSDLSKIVFVKTINDALDLVQRLDYEKVFFIGGREIYDYAYDIVDEMYITIVHKTAPVYDTVLKRMFDVERWTPVEDPITVYMSDPDTYLRVPSHTYLHYERYVFHDES